MVINVHSQAFVVFFWWVIFSVNQGKGKGRERASPPFLSLSLSLEGPVPLYLLIIRGSEDEFGGNSTCS